MSAVSRPPGGPMQDPATWDAVASGYAEKASLFLPYVEEALRIAEPECSGRVLDVAAGPGTLALVAAPRAAHVTAVDFSPSMIAEIEHQAARSGIGSLSARVMDAQALAFPDESFDAAFCMFGFMFFPDRARAFGEIRRVLRPGGRAVVATWGPIERRPLMKIGFDAVAEVLPDLPPPQKGDLQEPDEVAREMIAAGLRDVVAHRFSGSVRVDSPEHYVDVLARTGAPLALLRKKLGDEAWATVVPRLEEAVRRRLPGPTELSAEAVFASGRR